MQQKLEQIRQEAKAALAAAEDSKAVDELRVRYLGKKGEITAILKQMGSLSAEERPKMGQLANEVRADIESAIAVALSEMNKKALEKKIKKHEICHNSSRRGFTPFPRRSSRTQAHGANMRNTTDRTSHKTICTPQCREHKHNSQHTTTRDNSTATHSAKRISAKHRCQGHTKLHAQSSCPCTLSERRKVLPDHS